MSRGGARLAGAMLLGIATAGAAFGQTLRTTADSAAALLDSSRGIAASGASGSMQQALRMAQTSERLARRAANPRLLASAGLMLSAVYGQLRAPDSMLASGRRGLLAARVARAADLELEALFRVSEAYYRLSEPDSQLVYSRAGLAAADRANDVRAATLFLQGVVLAHWARGRADSAASAAMRAMALAAQANDTVSFQRAGENAYRLAGMMAEAAVDSVGRDVLYGNDPLPSRGLVTARDLWELAATLWGVVGDHEDALSLGVLNADCYLRQGQPDSALAVARAVEEAASAAGLGELRGHAIQVEARAFQVLGMADSLEAAVRRAAASVGAPDDRGEVEVLLAILKADEQARRGQVDSALGALQGRLEESRRGADWRVELRALMAMGAVYNGVDRQEPAVLALRQATLLATEHADTSSLILALGSMGTVWDVLGEPDSALAAHRHAWVVAAGGDPQQRARVALGLAMHFQQLGTVDSADTYFRTALQAPGFDRYPPVRLALAETANRRGDWRAALEHVRAVLAAAADTSNFSVRAWRLAGRAYLLAGAKDSAAAAFNASLRRARTLGLLNWEMSALQHLALLYLAPGSADSLRRSVAYADSGAAVAAQARRWAGGDENALELAERGADLFQVWATGWLLLAAAGAQPDASLAALAGC